MWPFRRRGGTDGEAPPEPAGAIAPSNPMFDAPARGEWRALPPIQRLLDPIEPVVDSHYDLQLASWRSPGVLRSLDHGVSALAPAGSVHVPSTASPPEASAGTSRTTTTATLGATSVQRSASMPAGTPSPVPPPSPAPVPLAAPAPVTAPAPAESVRTLAVEAAGPIDAEAEAEAIVGADAGYAGPPSSEDASPTVPNGMTDATVPTLAGTGPSLPAPHVADAPVLVQRSAAVGPDGGPGSGPAPAPDVAPISSMRTDQDAPWISPLSAQRAAIDPSAPPPTSPRRRGLGPPMRSIDGSALPPAASGDADSPIAVQPFAVQPLAVQPFTVQPFAGSMPEPRAPEPSDVPAPSAQAVADTGTGEVLAPPSGPAPLIGAAPGLRPVADIVNTANQATPADDAAGGTRPTSSLRGLGPPQIGAPVQRLDAGGGPLASTAESTADRHGTVERTVGAVAAEPGPSPAAPADPVLATIDGPSFSAPLTGAIPPPIVGGAGHGSIPFERADDGGAGMPAAQRLPFDAPIGGAVGADHDATAGQPTVQAGAHDRAAAAQRLPIESTNPLVGTPVTAPPATWSAPAGPSSPPSSTGPRSSAAPPSTAPPTSAPPTFGPRTSTQPPFGAGTSALSSFGSPSLAPPSLVSPSVVSPSYGATSGVQRSTGSGEPEAVRPDSDTTAPLLGHGAPAILGRSLPTAAPATTGTVAQLLPQGRTPERGGSVPTGAWSRSDASSASDRTSSNDVTIVARIVDPAAASDGQPSGPDAGEAAVMAGVAQRQADGSVVFGDGGANGGDDVVQREGSAPAPPAGTDAPAPGAGAAGQDLDELAKRLYGRMRLMLKQELRMDRERAGQLTQRR